MPPIGSQHVAQLRYRDATGEIGSFEVQIGAITAVSLPGFLTQFGAFQTATDNITLGVRAGQSWTGDRTVVSNDVPTDKKAQRENKLEVSYQDNVTEEIWSITVSTVDLDKCNFVPNGGDAVIFSGAGAHADIVAWVTAFEAMVKAPRTGNDVTVVGMRFVGVNS